MANRIKFKLLDKYKNPTYAISQKADGNMSYSWGDSAEVLNNRKRFLLENNLEPQQCVVVRVLDGTDILAIEDSQIGNGMFDIATALHGDALITDKSNIVLCLLIADCLPIFFYDPKQKVIALAHLGWKSTNGRLSQKVISQMIENYQCDPKNILVAIGPGIHKQSHIFDRPVLQESLPDWQPFLKEMPNNQMSIDNIGYNQKQLLDSGIKPANVEISPIDTANDQNYFSHYRSVRTGQPEGRFMVVLSLI